MATGVQVFTSGDTSAPQLYGAVGSLVTVLDAVLVNGYGSKNPAGYGAGGAWGITHTATNKRVYRPSAGNRLYLRINDNGAGTGGAKEALARGAESWSDIDTPTAPMPTDAQSTLTDHSEVIVKSAVADSITARPWIILADDRTMMLFVKSGNIANNYFPFYWGDFFSYVNSDGYRTAIIGRHLENSSSDSGTPGTPSYFTPTVSANQNGHFFQRKHDGTGVSLGFNKSPIPGEINNPPMIIGNGSITGPNSAGGLWFPFPIFMQDCTNNLVRGIVRGWYHLPQNPANLNDGDTFSGSGDLAGKTFRVIKGTANNQGLFVVETSDTWITSS